MKIFYILLLSFSLSIFSSCKDENPGGEDNPDVENPDSKAELYENPHCFLMGIKGNPEELVERRIQEEDGESFEVPYRYYFNEKGNLVKYDPFGDTELKSRWIPVDARIITYQYDDKNRLVEAVFHTMGVDGDDEVYTVEYADHDLYVPLPFAVGTMNFVLQKGVKSVKLNGEKILECDGVNKVEYSNEESMFFLKLIVNGTYLYENSKYPTTLNETKAAEESVVSKKNVKYSFNENGYLLREEILSDMSGEYEMPEGSYYEKIVREYNTDGYLTLNSSSFERKSSIDGMEIDMKYTLKYWYNDKKLLTGIVRSDEQGGITDGAEESYSYTDFDDYGNWINAKYWLNTDIDETHITGNFTVKRDYVYRQ